MTRNAKTKVPIRSGDPRATPFQMGFGVPTFEEVREEILALLESEARLQSLAALKQSSDRQSP